jgi:CRISPR-associated protein Cmr3
MSKIVLIELTPLDTFFFGGETTFGQDEGANYFAKSNKFPQQTTLLGALRHELLRQNDALPLPNDKAEKLIGSQSFDGTTDAAFGVIEKVSPVFMRQGDKNYFVRSREFVSVKKGGTDDFDTVSLELTLLENNAKRLWQPQSEKLDTVAAIPLLKKSTGESYNPKEYFTEELIAENEAAVNISDVFKKSEKVGITKYKDRLPKMIDNSLGFYKQAFYRLTSGWSFAYYVEFNSEDFKLEDSVITMGGESRPFAMKVIEKKDFDWDNSINKGNLYQDEEAPQYPTAHKVILLSDAYVSTDIYKSCVFAITDIVNFRNIQSKVATTTQWSDLSYEIGTIKPQKTTEKIQMLKRGSVLFTNDKDGLEDALNTPQYKRIGYNIYKIYSK